MIITSKCFFWQKKKNFLCFNLDFAINHPETIKELMYYIDNQRPFTILSHITAAEEIYDQYVYDDNDESLIIYNNLKVLVNNRWKIPPIKIYDVIYENLKNIDNFIIN